MVARQKELSAGEMTLTGAVARQVYWRCLTLQASWNDQRMQNLGLLAALAPWLQQQGLHRKQLRAICRQYFGYFNTNPYLAGFVIGGLLNLEHARKRGEAVSDRQISWMRDTMARACGALGDQLFWLGLRPALLLGVSLLAMIGHWELVLLLIFTFAVAQLWWRWRSLVTGSFLGLQVCQAIGTLCWHQTIAWARRTALALTGVLCGVYFASIDGSGGGVGSVSMLVLVCLGIALPILVRQKMAAELQLLLGLGCLSLLVLVLL